MPTAYVQTTLFDTPGPRVVIRTPGEITARLSRLPGGRAPMDSGRRSARPPVRRLSYTRVTRDPGVATAWDASHRLSAEITWQLARSIGPERLAELRAFREG